MTEPDLRLRAVVPAPPKVVYEALTDPAARERALEQAQARGTVQEAFAGRLLADPAAVRARVRETLEACAEAFFEAEWPALAARLAVTSVAAFASAQAAATERKSPTSDSST